jgi:hypothetical protein
MNILGGSAAYIRSEDHHTIYIVYFEPGQRVADVSPHTLDQELLIV